MRTVRRLYLYLVTLLSLELIVWGLINLLQNSLSPAPAAAPNVFASGLALILVGLPFFLLHAWLAQRDTRRDPEEQNSRIRAVFFYTLRLALLVPVVWDLFHLLEDLLHALLSVTPALNADATTSTDRLVAILINLAVWAIFERLLRNDWRAFHAPEAYIEVRRLSRYVWMLYGLGLWLPGLLQLLQYLLDQEAAQSLVGQVGVDSWINSLALLAVGLPLWLGWWGLIESTRDLPDERPSTLRWVVLYALALLAALIAFFAVQSLLQTLLQVAFGQPVSMPGLLGRISQPLSISIAFGVLSAFFYRHLQQEWLQESDDLLRAGLRRLYQYPLALAGNIAVFAGAWQLLGQLVQFLVASTVWSDLPRRVLAGAIAWLIVGAFFWLGHWPALQREAAQLSEVGDHARRSVLRKSYLYLAVFLTVVGLMASAGVLFYRLINALLGNPGVDLALEAWLQVRALLLLGVWLAYHQAVLRADGRLALRALSARQGAYPVWILQEFDEPFFDALATALQRQAPDLPMRVLHNSAELAQVEASQAQALVLPAAAALQPSAPLADWLSRFTGQRVVVPLPSDSWQWAGLPPRSPNDLAHVTAQLLRQLSEGQAVRPAAPTNPWVVAGYILGGLFALLLGFIFLSLFASGF